MSKPRQNVQIVTEPAHPLKGGSWRPQNGSALGRKEGPEETQELKVRTPFFMVKFKFFKGKFSSFTLT